MGTEQNGAARGLVHAAALHAHEAVFHQVDPSDPMPTRDFIKFFNNPMTVRPNLQVRMPSFHQINDQEWDTIIKYFQSIDDENTGYRAPHEFAAKSSKYKAGEKVHELGACNNCHFYGTDFPTQVASTWAPNLALTKERLNPEFEGQFKIMLVPNITNICYGRGVGYKIEEIVLDEETQKISATKIRAKMREEGKLK